MNSVRVVFFLFLFAFPCQSLICPIYNIYNNETNSIQYCDVLSSLCNFSIVRSSFRRCLGIYQLAKHQIYIRQLAVLDDFENRYVNRTDCVLEIDKMGENLLCRCNSDNCTLNWRTSRNASNEIFFRKLHLNSSTFENNNWALPLTMLCSMLTLVGIVGFVIFLTNRHQKLIVTHLSTTNFDEIFSSSSIVSQGQNSIVYRTSTIDKNLAIKLYRGNQSKSLFETESTILRLTQHSTIINFIDSGWHGESPYIFLEYHHLGSLQNYLSSTKLCWTTSYSFVDSLLQAVDYLHYEDLSANDYLTLNRIRKPIIIHRDIKSSNIVVKSTPTASLCLIDFGLAKVLPPILTANDFIQIGTYRYMAPELLELAISYTSEALCKVDMYAVGLVMWEIISQCDEYPFSVDYQLPYAEYLQSEETNENRILDVLHRTVVNERKRPILHRTSTMNSKMPEMFTIIEDCWAHEPEFRINARPALARLRRIQ